jgi:hypothetical protein
MWFVAECCKAAEADEEWVFQWFTKKSRETRRKRLHGWRLWQEFCTEKELTGAALRKAGNPAMIVTQFVWYMDEKGIKSTA